MTWTVWRLVGALVVIGALSAGGCFHRNDDLEPVHQGPVPEEPGPSETPDGGADGGPDGGLSGSDAGTGTSDGGVGEPLDGGSGGRPDGGSGGRPDGGSGGRPDGGGGGPPDGGAEDGGTVVFPPRDGWQFHGPQQGGPRKVYGVTSDQGGNIWVAGGAEGLFLLRPGAASFQRFTAADGLSHYADATGVHGYDVISVAGGPPGTVIVGYQGLYAGQDDNDPPYMVRSGDADRVTLTGGGISVTHFDISTPPGEDPHYPAGRDKIRSVYRMVYNRGTGDIWFAGNHGVALWDARLGRMFEHQHAAINGYTDKGEYTLLSGDWSVALDPSGDAWIGGGHRLARMRFASEGRQFWARLDPILDVWPDAVPDDGRPHQRTDDFIQDIAVAPDGTVWVGSIPNGLARISSSGVGYIRSGMADPKIVSLELDPRDGSLWIGHLSGGLTRIKDGRFMHYSYGFFPLPLLQGCVWDIQSDLHGGRRRILVAFENGAIGIYTGD